MKLVIHNDHHGLRGGERQIEFLARGLMARGHDVLVSCPPGSALRRRLEHLGVRTTSVRPRGDLNLVAALRFAWLLRRERPRAVLLTSWRRIFWGTRAARLAGVSRVVVRLAGVRRVPGRWKYASTLRKHVDVVIASSRDVRDVFLESAPWFAATAVQVVRNATPRLDAARSGVVRGELDLEPTTPLVVSIASLAPRTGVDTLIEAFRGLGSAHLAVVGDGPQRDELEARMRLAGLERRVHFLGARTDIPDILGDADLFVLASRNDSFSNAMLEAMAAGLPVVATDVGGVREALGSTGDRDPAGWVVTPDDAAALAKALRRALAAVQAGEAAGMAAEATRRAREWYGPERMVDESEQLLFGASASGATP